MTDRRPSRPVHTTRATTRFERSEFVTMRTTVKETPSTTTTSTAVTTSANVLRRIGRFGSGWIPWGDDAIDPGAGMPRVREALDQAGRDASGFQVTAALPSVKGDAGLDLDRTMERVPAMVEAGITDFRAYLPIPDDPSSAEDFLSQVVSAFREATGRAGPSARDRG